jgi:hypothetical protein
VETQQQAGFGAGVWEGQDQLNQAPDGTVKSAADCFVDPQGALRSRNGAPLLQGTTWATDRLSWVWEGALSPGLRTIFATRSVPGSPGATNAGHGIGVLDGSNNSAANFSPGGYYYMDYPLSAVLLDSMLFIGGPGAALAGGDNTDTTKQGMLYGGSRKTATYTPGGTIAVTLGSAVVTRAAGGFTANVDAGMLMFSPGAGSAPRRYHVVKSVDSDTQVTLVQPYAGATGTITPDFRPLALIGAGATGGSSYRASALYGSCAGRLLSLEANKLFVSDGPDPTTGASRAHSFPTKNIIEFPSDAQGISVQTIRNQVFVFTAAGLYRVTGLEYEIVDADGNPQWTIELLSRETVAVNHAAIVTWHQALIVPCLDAIYIVDGVNPPQSITPGVDWQTVVNSGRNLGQAAIFRGYYLLPVETAAGSFAFTTYCFRLQPVETTRGLVFPNTRWTCDVEAYTSSSAQRLVMAAANLKLWQGGAILDPAAAPVNDGNAAAVQGAVETRPFTLGHGAVVRRVRVRAARQAGAAAGIGLKVGVSSSSDFDSGAASDGSEWVAIDSVGPRAATMPTVLYAASTRFALLAAEVQYRAANLPGVGA